MFQRELEVALEAVGLAEKHLVQAYAHFQAIPNAPANITTDADRQSQEIILQHVLKVFPQDALCAEESTPTLASRPHTGPRLWIVDPIDGTRGFAQKNGEFSVMVGFVHEGRIEVGVVAQPATQRLTYATRGGGCWRVDAGQAPVRCQVTRNASLAQATLTQSRSKEPSQSRGAKTFVPARILESHSAGIKLALVARGEADIYLNTYTAFHDWDICAGHVLVTEAGGKVSGMVGQELQYGLPEAWQRNGLLASNGVLHKEAVKRLRD